LIALAAESARHVGQIAVSGFFQHLARSHRAPACLAAHHQLLALRENFLDDLDKLRIYLHLSRSLDEHHRDVDRTRGVALGEFALRANVKVNRVGVLLQSLERLGRLGLLDRHWPKLLDKLRPTILAGWQKSREQGRKEFPVKMAGFPGRRAPDYAVGFP
jgi:hypothetical protein